MKIRQIKLIALKKLLKNGKLYIILSIGTALLLVFLAGTKYLTKTFCEIFCPDIFNLSSISVDIEKSEIIKKMSACALTDIMCVLMMIPAVFILYNIAVIFISDKDKSDIYRTHISVRRIYSCAWAVIWRYAAAFSLTFAVYYVCGWLYEYAVTMLGHLISETIIMLFCGFPVCLSVLMCIYETASLFPLAYISIIFYDVPIKKAVDISREASKDRHTQILLFNLSFIFIFILSYLSFGVIFVLYAFPMKLLASAIYSSHLVNVGTRYIVS